MPSLLIATSLYHHPLKITPRDLLPDTTWAWALELQTPFQEVTHPSFASRACCAPKDSLLCWSTQHSSCSRPPHHNPTIGWFQEVTEIIGSSSYLLGWGGGIKAQSCLNYLNLRTISVPMLSQSDLQLCISPCNRRALINPAEILNLSLQRQTTSAEQQIAKRIVFQVKHRYPAP